jgi:hypothetical protein
LARYFFKLRNSVGDVPDHEGREFPDDAAARMHAIGTARALMSEDIKEGRLLLTDLIEVSDERGGVVVQLKFSDAVEIICEPPTQVRGPSPT